MFFGSQQQGVIKHILQIILNYINNMKITPRIFIEDKILDLKEEISGVHQFFPPKEDLVELIYKKSVNYCRHFGPYHKATNINGEYVSFQIYGTILGVNCRKKIAKLRQGESIKSRFGIYLVKDFIPFAKKINLMTDPVIAINKRHCCILFL